jgi:putative DNA primase/helicase
LANASVTANAELVAKASAFEKEKVSFVLKNHPDLAPGYGVVDVAKKFAEAHLPENAREEFVGLARRHVAQKIITGEAVKGPKIYVAHAKSKIAGDRTPEVTKEAHDRGKSPRAKEVAKER